MLGGLGTLLAAVGLYGVVNFMVVQRTGEVGIRMALGANRSSIMLLIVRPVLLAGVGVTIGLIAAVWIRRVSERFVFGLSGMDLWTVALAVILLIVVAVMAAAVPARRAARIDPVIALRAE